LLLPVPPLSAIETRQILIGAGAVIWYVALPFTFIGARELWRDSSTRRFILAALSFASAALIGLAFTSLDVRHKIVIFPLCMLLAAHGFKRSDVHRKHTIALIGGLSVYALALLYFTLKLL
jgi:hypothetical protein